MRQRVIACLLVFAVIAVLLPQTAYGASLLKYGSRGTEVKNLQQQLIKLGYLKGKADGIFGSQTRAAVIKFQKDYKLKQDGIVGPETRSKLSAAMSALQKGSGHQSNSQQSDKSNSNNAPITATLKKGSRGNQVKTLQKRLNELGFNCGAVDGIFGSKTHNAVVKFQKAKGLTANGVVDSKTVAKLFETSGGSSSSGGGSSSNNKLPITTTLKKGSRGDQVKVLQKRLNELGFNCGAVDGIFGSNTHNAVVKFQKAKGLTANGIVDSKTVEKLFASGSSETPKPEPKPEPNPDTGFKQFHGKPGSLAGKTIFVDAGHGGVDSGATKNGVMEKTLVLDMAKRLKRILEEAGAKVILTRPDDKFYSLHYRSAFVNKYILDNELSVVSKEKDTLEKDKKAKQAEANQKENEIKKIANDIDEYENELHAKEDYLAQLEIKRDKLEEKLPIGEVLSGKLHKLADLISNQEENQEKISELKAEIADLNGQLEDFAIELDLDNLDLDNLNRAIEQAEGISEKFNAVGQEIEEVDSSIKSLNKQVVDAEKAIEQLEEDIEELESEIKALNEKIGQKDKQIQKFKSWISEFEVHINNPSVQQYTRAYADNTDPNTGKRKATDVLKGVMDLTAQKYHDDYLFISIHCNATSASEQTSASGVMLFYRDNGPYAYNGTYGKNTEYYQNYNAQKREKLARKLIEQLNATTNFSKKNNNPYKADFSVLRENNLISVLVEVGFINNPNDLALLIKEQTREDVAAGIYKGIVEYYK